jgi:hypothetical protein
MMRIRGIIGAQIFAVIVLLGSTGLFAGLCKNDQLWFSRESNLNLKRIISPGTRHTYSISFDRDNINNLRVTKNVTLAELRNSVQAASKLHWIGKSTANKLIRRLQNAEAALAKSQNKTAKDELNAFIKEVNGWNWLPINKKAAEMLADDAQTLIKQWK